MSICFLEGSKESITIFDIAYEQVRVEKVDLVLVVDQAAKSDIGLN